MLTLGLGLLGNKIYTVLTYYAVFSFPSSYEYPSFLWRTETKVALHVTITATILIKPFAVY